MLRVIVESPYKPKAQPRTPEFDYELARNEAYARACMRDCLARGEAPFASHLLYTQTGILSDTDPAERAQGIEAGLCWGAVADKTVVYDDLGISEGMMAGMTRASDECRPIEIRQLPRADLFWSRWT